MKVVSSCISVVEKSQSCLTVVSLQQVGSRIQCSGFGTRKGGGGGKRGAQERNGGRNENIKGFKVEP